MRVLVLSAHMDDEVLGMGGTIAKHVAAGDEVTVCIACKRAYNHQFDPKLIEEEKESAKRAAKILGYKEIRFMDLRDELLDERLLDVVVPIEKCIQETQPSIIYTHHRGDANQDHRAIFQASSITCRSISSHKVSQIFCYEVPSSTDQAPPLPEWAFQPNYYVNIEKYLGQKLEAMKCFERELRKFPHPRSLKGIEITAQKRGVEIGFHAAEAFVMLRSEWA